MNNYYFKFKLKRGRQTPPCSPIPQPCRKLTEIKNQITAQVQTTKQRLSPKIHYFTASRIISTASTVLIQIRVYKTHQQIPSFPYKPHPFPFVFRKTHSFHLLWTPSLSLSLIFSNGIISGEGWSWWKTNKSANNLHDRCWWFHWVPPVWEDLERDSTQDLSPWCLQWQDQAPSRTGQPPLGWPDPVPPYQYQTRLSPRRPHQDVRSGIRFHLSSH